MIVALAHDDSASTATGCVARKLALIELGLDARDAIARADAVGRSCSPPAALIAATYSDESRGTT